MTVKTDTQRRSAEKQAGVLIRMSALQRLSLQRHAQLSGKSVNDFVLDLLKEYVTSP